MRWRISACIWMVLAMPSHAADRFGGSLSMVSDYLYRGISQSSRRPAIQGDLHYAARGFVAGLSAASVELNAWDGRTVELTPYVGVRWPLNSDWSARLAAVRYEYPQNRGYYQYDYSEFVGTLGYRNSIFATAAWSFDTSRYSTRGHTENEAAGSYEIAASLPVKVGRLNVGVAITTSTDSLARATGFGT